MPVIPRNGKKNHNVHTWRFQVFDQVYTPKKIKNKCFNFFNHHIDLFQFFAIVKKLQLSLIYVLQSVSRLQNVIWGITSHFDKWISQKSDFELLW
jgi:hypothetical protein